MKTMKDCHNLELKCDVLSLANVFEKFRNKSSKTYRLFPSVKFLIKKVSVTL